MRTLRSPQGSLATAPDDLAEALLSLGWVEEGRRVAREAEQDTKAPRPAQRRRA